ncbi:hypothetical protein CG08_0205 [Riemerella anatipestifer]|nr:hypothetical protein CG08_0205 [Riemerella anatipestifer]
METKETKRNFYFRNNLGNNEAIEIYIGQSSGKQLQDDLLNAKSEVLIISPYIDESKLDDLFVLKNRNVNVRLGFSDLNDRQYKTVLRKLIHQNKETDIKKKEKRKKKNLYLFLLIAVFSIACVFFSSGIVKLLNKDFTVLSFGFIMFSFFLSFLSYKLWQIKSKIEKIEIYKLIILKN